MKALLLRVAMDTGGDGALGPIFDDGTFEYIPISEYDGGSLEKRTYANTHGRSGRPLAEYIPKDLGNRKIHFDPEFETYTYGDPTPKRRYMLGLNPGDLLVFYAGLKPHKTVKHNKGLYIIGYFKVREVIDFDSLPTGERKDKEHLCRNNAHIKRRKKDAGLVIVRGEPGESRLLKRALLISAPKLDRRGTTYYAASPDLEKSFGIVGSIQRSATPRTVTGTKEISVLLSERWLGGS